MRRTPRTTDIRCWMLAATLSCSCTTSGRDFSAAKRDAAVAIVAPDAAIPEASDADVLDSASASAPVTCDSTWQAIQTSIFAAKGCSAAVCHRGSAPQGGLDLSPEHAYEQLIYRSTTAALTTPLYRVHPGEQALSFLYLKLQAATQGTVLPSGAGAPMPVGTSALSADQLAAVRLWIRAGAPEKGLVADTQALLGCDAAGDVDPNKAPRPPVPSPELGFQHAAGPWTVAANSENEVCFATYYDLSDSAPDWARLPCDLFNDGERTCVGYKRRQLTQDAQSHHSIIQVYAGTASATDPAFGKWRCAGGAVEGTTCDPTRAGMAAELGGADCGSQGVCQTEPLKATTCRGYGPSDHDTRSLGSGGAQSPVSTDDYPQGVYARLPIKGVVVWNSHGFNLTKKSASIEQYNTFWYAQPQERVYLVRGIFDTRNIFAMNVPPFEAREYCATFTLPRYARLSELSSHVHKRGLRWRTWLPPNSMDCTPSNGCLPSDGPPAYESFSYNDPVSMALSPALEFNSDDASTRTLKYCAVFDNGKTDPKLVKRKSMLPDGARACTAPDSYCVGGANHAQRCDGDDANCPGGACDACTVSGGVTTEDEMFILLGNYYVVPPSP
jgi:hypothetical protein